MSKSPVPMVVLLDAYGTLLELDDPVGRLRHGLSAAGYEHDDPTVASAFRTEVAFYRRHQDQGTDPARLQALQTSCARVFADSLPSRPPVAVALEVLAGALRYRLFDDVVPMLTAVTARGLRCAVVSNWDCSLAEVLADLGILDRFAAVSVSAVVGAPKPDARIFEHALSALGVDAAHTVHVGDDRERDVAGARSAGLHALLLDRAGDAVHPRPDTITSLSSLPALLE